MQMRLLFPVVAMFLAAFLIKPAVGLTDSVSFPHVPVFSDSGNDETVSGLISKPEGKGPFPAVVLLHSCGGFKPHVTTDWPNYLREIGYVALSVDTFGSRGFTSCPDRPKPFSRERKLFVGDAYGALDYLATQPFVDKNRIAVMGFSLSAVFINGGLIPWRVRGTSSLKGKSTLGRQMKSSPGKLDFKAAIALYGWCSELGLYSKENIPLMEILAENDPVHTRSCVAAGEIYPEMEVHVIAGAYHAFDSFGSSGGQSPLGERMEYSAEATKQARELTRVFLAKKMSKKPGP